MKQFKKDFYSGVVLALVIFIFGTISYPRYWAYMFGLSLVIVWANFLAASEPKTKVTSK